MVIRFITLIFNNTIRTLMIVVSRKMIFEKETTEISYDTVIITVKKYSL